MISFLLLAVITEDLAADNPVATSINNIFFFTITVAAVMTLFAVIYIFRMLAKRTTFIEE